MIQKKTRTAIQLFSYPGIEDSVVFEVSLNSQIFISTENEADNELYTEDSFINIKKIVLMNDGKDADICKMIL